VLFLSGAVSHQVRKIKLGAAPRIALTAWFHGSASFWVFEPKPFISAERKQRVSVYILVYSYRCRGRSGGTV